MKNKNTSSPITPNINTLFAQALAQHQAGMLGAAKTLYERILTADNKHVNALGNLGLLYMQHGHLQEAVQLIGRSLEISPKQPIAYNNLGVALKDLKRLDEALICFDRAISLKPNFPEAHNNRGIVLQDFRRLDEALASYDRALALKPNYAEAFCNRGNTFQDLKRHDEALTCYNKAIAIKPDYAEAYSYRGLVFQNLKRYEEALTSYDRALALKPNLAEAHNNRGNTLKDLKRLDEALASFDRALALKPNFPEAHNNRGIALQELNRLDEALASYDRALSLRSHYAEAFCNQGNALKDLMRLDEALTSYDRAITLKPDYAEAFCNRGAVLQKLKRIDEALTNYDHAIALKPDYAEAYNNRGIGLQDLNRLNEALASYRHALALKSDFAEAFCNQGIVLQDFKRLDEALVSYDQALTLKPDFAEAYNNRGNVLQDLKRHSEALASYDKAIGIKPDLPYVLGSWLHSKMHSCNWEGLDVAYANITNAIDRSEKASSPFPFIAIPSTPAQQKKCARTFIDDKHPPNIAPLWQGERYAHNRIRIGYFSADFHNHATAHLMAELLERHDHSRFEIIGFSFGPLAADSWRARLEKTFDRFFNVKTQSDKEIAALARELEIDIAVDLKGHTQDARTGVFALHPAPTQVSYLGYPGTIGANYIEYLIADPTLIPEEHRQFYSEKIVYLPHSYQVNDSTKVISDKSFTRAELDLPENAFVFCCFNNNYKITPDLFDIWMRLLRAVEGSVLWLLKGSATAVDNLRREAEKCSISPDRLVFAPAMELADHLARHRHADLFLDTFYCNAHTTASDALWAGLPLLTCLGETFAGRVAASLLNAIGLPELIARSHAEYEALALELVRQSERLASIRQKLATNRTTQPLFDTARFTHYIEEAYMKMHERHQAGLSPDHIVVKA